MTTPASPPPSWRPGTFRALRHRNYRLYFLGQIVSLTGTWVQTAALTWLAYELTRQSLWPALVSAAGVVPTLLLGVWGGGLADRWPRRPLIFLAQSAFLVLSLLLAGMCAIGAVTPYALLTVSLLIGVVNAIDTPARLAFVIDMVGRDDLLNAVALNSLVFNLARAIGPALSGWLLPLAGPAACFVVNAVTFFAILVALVAMRLPPRVPPPEMGDEEPAVGGFRYLAARPDLLLLVLMAAALAFFGWPLLSLLPAVSDQWLQAGDKGYAWMLSGIGVGALIGALIVASFGTQARRSMLALGVITGVAALVGLAVTKLLSLAVVWCALSGCGLILFFATGQATLQLGAGEHNRGRIMGIWLMVLAGAQPAGNLFFGWLADACGVRLTLLIEAGGIVVAAGVVAVLGIIWGRRTQKPVPAPELPEAVSPAYREPSAVE